LPGDAGFAVNEAKSAFGQSLIAFLGHLVSGNGIRPNSAKLEALRMIRPPQTLQELQSLMGFLNFWDDTSLCLPLWLDPFD
jgi:hypothetical protein